MCGFQFRWRYDTNPVTLLFFHSTSIWIKPLDHKKKTDELKILAVFRFVAGKPSVAKIKKQETQKTQ